MHERDFVIKFQETFGMSIKFHSLCFQLNKTNLNFHKRVYVQQYTC